MKTTAAITALLASCGIVAALPEPGNGWGTTKGHLTSSCWTSSTCAASTWYSTEIYTKPVTVTATYTVYKPETVTTEVPSVYTSTEYSSSRTPRPPPLPPITNTHLPQSPNQSTTPQPTCTQPPPKVPSTTYTTVCYTKPVETWVYSSSVCTETKVVPSQTVYTSAYPETTEVPSTYVTSTPCPEVTTKVSYSPYTTVCTETTTKCATETGWKTWTAYGW